MTAATSAVAEQEEAAAAAGGQLSQKELVAMVESLRRRLRAERQERAEMEECLTLAYTATIKSLDATNKALSARLDALDRPPAAASAEATGRRPIATAGCSLPGRGGGAAGEGGASAPHPPTEPNSVEVWYTAPRSGFVGEELSRIEAMERVGEELARIEAGLAAAGGGAAAAEQRARCSERLHAALHPPSVECSLRR
mmetsp:Transcript_27135/g.79227  ORF Transcript_27135/g.79227 Transcript_27135/m.79227 type:complete len:198 (+) Transcript_27135:196-789(+)